ncbi:tetratricopeptide repeat protein [Streptomyces sp. LMG1-1-1.1]|uniref:tetratricopeptide repeat protein n=1 Tax=Streptomyces sp. LMG1-1-1.1 TaxID=3135245 RepID=UPI003467552C
MTQLLAASGLDLSHEELLDALWLAGRLPQGAGPLARAAERNEPSDPDGTPAPHPETPDPASESAPARTRRPPRPTHPLLASADGHRTAADGAEGPTPAHPVTVPDRHSLGPGRLRLEKSLRPLRQRFPDPRRHALDIPRTVAAIAETGVRETVTRPLRTRWLTLALVVDDGVSMVLWQRLASDVRTLMERAGSFRDVRVYGLDTRGGTPTLRSSPYSHDGRPESPKALCDPTGNTLVLVLSDGVGEAWRDGGMHRVMRSWARSGPTAILHALPTRLWPSTGITARPWQVTTPGRGGPTRSWQVTDPDLPPELVRFDSVPVPVLEPTPTAVGEWARLVAAPGATALLPLWDADRSLTAPAAAADQDPPDSEPRTTGAASVLRFKAAASIEAYRLAAHMAAVAPVTPPVMRLVQAALGPPTDPGHLTEVFLGGLMHEVDPAEPRPLPHLRRFDFAPDASRALLTAVPPRELLHTADALTRRLESAIGRAPVFPAWVGHPDGTALIDHPDRSFGWIRSQLLTRLGIPPLPETEDAPRTSAPNDGDPLAHPVTPVPHPEDPEPYRPEYQDAGSLVVSAAVGAVDPGEEGPGEEVSGEEGPESSAASPGQVGRNDVAIALRKHELADRMRVLGADHPETFGARTDLAFALRDAGRFDEAIALLDTVCADSERVLGADHHDTLVARADLGYSLRKAGRLDEAIALEEQVLADRGRVMGPEHSATLAAAAAVAFSYYEAGRTEDAVVLEERVLAVRERVMGPDHPSTLTARTTLAFSYWRAGRLDESIALRERVVADSERARGSDDPATLTARADLARAFRRVDRTDEAIALQEGVVAARERVLGQEHADTITARADLAFSYGKADRFDEAIALEERVVVDFERVLGPEHPDTLTARADLAFSLRQVGRTDEAIRLEQRVLAVRERTLGPEHADTVNARVSLAFSYYQAGRSDEAIALEEPVLAVRERVLGPDHSDTVAARANLASSYRQAGRLDEAVALQEGVLADRERALGRQHPRTVSARAALAISYYQMGRSDEAIALEEPVLAIRERTLGPDHPDTVNARVNLAFSYQQAGRIDEAVALQERVLRDAERVLGPEHPDTLTARHDLDYSIELRGRSRQISVPEQGVLVESEEEDP